MRREKLEESFLKPLTSALQHVFPDIRTISGCGTDPEIVIDGRSVLLICSPNYLGLASHPGVIVAMQDATQRYGAGTVGSGLISGYTTAHQRVERDLVGGYGLNVASDVKAGNRELSTRGTKAGYAHATRARVLRISPASDAAFSSPSVLIRVALQISCAIFSPASLTCFAPSADIAELAARVNNRASSCRSK